MMNLLRISGMVISAGFVLYVVAMLAAPRGMYETEIIARRLEIIAANQIRWNVSQLFFALGLGVPAVGLLLLTLSQRAATVAWLYYLGTALFAAGAALGMWLVYTQTLDPAAFWEGAQIPVLTGYTLLLTSAGLLCLGIALLQGAFPTWLGYLLAGSAVIFLIATAVSWGRGGFFISIFVLLVTFVAGIVIWRHG